MNVNIYRGDLRCCRVCLATDIKLISFDHHLKLKQTYFDFSGVTITATDGLPQHICVFCWAFLKKSSDFRQKCQDTYTLLAKQLLDIHALTTSYIDMLDKSNLRPPLTIADIWQCNCVPDDVICVSDGETSGLDDNYENKDSEPENQKIDNIKKESELTFDDDMETQNDSLSTDENILNEDEQRIEEFKNNHYYSLMNSEKNIFYYYILEKYIKSKKEMYKDKKDMPKITLNIDVKDYELTINTIENCNSAQNESQKKLYEFINCKYIERNTSQVKQNKCILSKSLAKLSKDYNVDVTLMCKQDIIKEVLKRKESDLYKNAKYKCELCFMSFAQASTFQNHMTIHDPSLPYSCEYCHVRYKTSYRLKNHIARTHKYKFVCRECGQIRRTITEAREHHRSHSGDSYLCQHCGKTFNKYKTRLKHIRINHSSVPCDICHMLFASDMGLIHHKTMAHKESFKCTVCLVKFHNANALQRHTEVTEKACGAHIRPCTRCGSSFDTVMTLQQHMLVVHPPRNEVPYRRPIVRGRRSYKAKGKPLTCEVCSVGGFQHPSTLFYHKQRYHSSERFQCDYCKKTFKMKTSIMLHIRQIHLGERRFSCPHADCGRAFKQRNHLAYHLAAHSNAKPFMCDSCPKTFKFSASLNEHKQTVHEGKPRRKRNLR